MVDERKIMELHRARRAGIHKYLLGFILLIGSAYIYLFRPAELNMIPISASADYISSVLVFIGIIIILYAEAGRRGSHYYLTQYRIVCVNGLLMKKEIGMQVSLVESVRIHQSLFGRMLGIGDVVVKTSGETLNISKVGNPSKVETIILAEMSRPGDKGFKRPEGRE
jgi:uncharacterized membrane protein YdbT with pleckstrin-like domain